MSVAVATGLVGNKGKLRADGWCAVAGRARISGSSSDPTRSPVLGGWDNGVAWTMVSRLTPEDNRRACTLWCLRGREGAEMTVDERRERVADQCAKLSSPTASSAVVSSTLCFASRTESRGRLAVRTMGAGAVSRGWATLGAASPSAENPKSSCLNPLPEIRGGSAASVSASDLDSRFSRPKSSGIYVLTDRRRPKSLVPFRFGLDGPGYLGGVCWIERSDLLRTPALPALGPVSTSEALFLGLWTPSDWA